MRIFLIVFASFCSLVTIAAGHYWLGGINLISLYVVFTRFWPKH